MRGACGGGGDPLRLGASTLLAGVCLPSLVCESDALW